MTLEHVQQRGNRKVYRRKVPRGMKEALGKGEIILPLGKTDAEVRKNYDRVHQKAQAILAAAWDEAKGANPLQPAGGRSPSAQSAREKYHQTVADVKALGFNPFRDKAAWEEDEEVARDITADEILDKYPLDERTGNPIGLTESEHRLVKALYNGPGNAPPPSLDEARRLYLDDRFTKSNPTPLARKKDEQRAVRAIGHIVAALGSVPDITSLKRRDARSVQAHMLATINSPETVERYLNDIRAILNHAIKEFDLAGFINPFMGLAAVTKSQAEAARKKRKPFTAEQLGQTRSRILTQARDELKLIWRLLEGTGCRLSEITGLRTIDVVTDGEIPHVDVEWHEERRVKTEVSRRKVPLIGDALVAAQEAVRAAGDAHMLFAGYGREGGGDAASAALMKHVRAVSTDPKLVVHSLRHNMKDRLRKAKVSKIDQDLILGHTLGGVGESYGGEDVRLEIAAEAMRKARALEG